MADPIGTTAAQIQAFTKDVQDLGKQWDEIARRFDEGDLSKLIKLDKASADMQKFMTAVNGTTSAIQKQHRVEKELNKVYQEGTAKRLTLNKELQKIREKEKELKKNNQKFSPIEKAQRAELRKHLLFEKDKLREVNKLRTPQSIQKLSDETDNLEHSMQMANVKTFIWKKALEMLIKVFTGVYNWNERLQKNLATLAERFGSATDAIMGMAAVAKSEFLARDGLGGMGFTLEEITSKLGDFREQMEFTGKITDQQALKLLKYGMAVGMSAQEVGEFSRAIVIMGGKAEDTADFLFDIKIAADKAGVSQRALAKQFMGAGKALFELTGPKARQALTESARVLAKMGMGLDKLKGFTDMTDNFDQTAESVAALNTVFGTYVNALEVFDELDPAKRMLKFVKAMQMQGMTPDMIRTEKKFLQDKLQVSEETANAVLRAASSGEDYSKVLEEQNKIEQERLETQQKFDEVLQRGKKVLIAWDQITNKFFDKFEGSGLVKQLKGVFDKIMDFVESDAMQTLADGLGSAVEIIGDVINVVLAAIGPFARVIATVVGTALNGIGMVWKIIKRAAGVLGFDLGSAAVSNKDLVQQSEKTLTGAVKPLETPEAYAENRKGDINTKNMPESTFEGMFSAQPTNSVEYDTYADGGKIRANRLSMVGESGPELFNPSSGGTIISNQEIMQAAAAAAGANGAPGAKGADGSSMQTIQVQLILDGEILQDKLYKTNLRRNS